MPCFAARKQRGYDRMKNTMKKRVSGFTLLEMMIVIAIVAILTGVMVPAMLGYSSRSKLNAQNSNAKVLFNSIQTIMQEYEFQDRNEHNESVLYGTGAQKNGTLFIRVFNDARNPTVVDFDNKRKDGTTVPAVGADFHGGNLNAATSSTFLSRLSRLFPDLQEVSFCVIVRDYSVLGVLSAETKNAAYIGGYPMRTESRATLNSISPHCSVSSISAASRSDLIDYSKDAWNDQHMFDGYA